MLEEFLNRRVLVTGAASGLGLQVAEMLIERGARVFGVDRDAAGLARLADRTGCSVATCDIADPDAVQATVDNAGAALGGLDGLVNAAGIVHKSRVSETSVADWLRVISVNLTGTFLVSRACVPLLEESGDAAIVDVASGVALVPFKELAAYAASKGGVISLSKVMAMELGARVRVNVVAPGTFDSPLFTKGKSDEQMAAAGANYAMGRVGRMSEVAEAILFLLGKRSGFVTGTVLAVDGGRTFH